MPLDITPNIITLDKVRIEQFTISPQLNAVMIHYSRGYNNENGQYIAKEYDHMNFENVSFDPALYEQVKNVLYTMLQQQL